VDALNSKQRRQQKRMWPYVVTLKVDWLDILEVADWLTQNIGRNNCKVKHWRDQFYFKREKDASLFTLRWAGK
jgi:hypothetical protein